MIGFPGDYSTFREAFGQKIGSPWEALLTVPWRNTKCGWTSLFSHNRSWAVVTDRAVNPAKCAYGRCVSPVTSINWGGKVVRVWRLEPLTIRPPVTFREAYPKAISRPRPGHLRLV